MLAEINRIKREVAKRWGFTVVDLEGPKRGNMLAYARHEAMYRIRKETPCSLPEVGYFFGRRHHTSVLYACRRIERDIKAGKYKKIWNGNSSNT